MCQRLLGSYRWQGCTDLASVHLVTRLRRPQLMLEGLVGTWMGRPAPPSRLRSRSGRSPRGLLARVSPHPPQRRPVARVAALVHHFEAVALVKRAITRA